MKPEDLNVLLVNLETSQHRLADLLLALAGHEPGQDATGRSVRGIAAHLAAVERECFMDRVIRIAKGRNTTPFENFKENGHEHAGLDVGDSVDGWRAARRAIFAYLRTLPEPAWGFTGRHAERGAITIRDVLEEMLEHDRMHFEELNLQIARL